MSTRASRCYSRGDGIDIKTLNEETQAGPWHKQRVWDFVVPNVSYGKLTSPSTNFHIEVFESCPPNAY